eukprot:TRINITY_DN1045_c0_g3_i1.p1 TRINITY_DN1045_c0_g3~~TRINITY_DN1045_c0_g3_i1.p1  ORF type:complete len:894 (-),score=96.82 TRINITY_DN1045_c0_g3_i1:153-2834(-)
MMRIGIILCAILCACQALELPQVRTLGAGFDAVQNKQTVPIIDLTFSTNTWINPFGNTTAYSVPDQVYVANRYGMKTDNSLYYTSSNYSQGLAQEYGLGFDKLSNWFSLDVQKKEQELDQKQKTFSKISQHLTMFQATLLPTSKLALTESFHQAVNALPNWIDNEKYKSFFEFTGTHVIVDIVVGGQSEYHTYGESSFLSSGTGFLLGGNAKVGFGVAKSNFGGQYSRSQVSDSFTSNAQSNYVRSGGNPEIPEKDWRNWVKTVPTNPVVLKQKLVPVTEFIEDSSKRTLVEQALQSYSSAYKFPPKDKKQTITAGYCNCQTLYGNSFKCSPGQVMASTTRQGSYTYGSITCCTPCPSWSQSSFGTVRTRIQEPSAKQAHLQQEKMRSHQLFEEKRRMINAAHRDSGLSKCGSHECLPGLDSFGVGFDGLTGDIKNIGFFDWTYQKGSTYTDPFDSSITYSYPDQLSIQSTPVKNNAQNTFKSSQDYTRQLAQDVGLGFEFPFFGLSAEAKFAESVFTGQQAVYVESKDEVGYYSLTLPPPNQLTLSSVLRDAIAALPTRADYAAYGRFVNRFGTHFISKSLYGGRVKMNTYVDSQYAQKTSSSVLNLQVKTMLEAFKLDFAANVTSTSGFSDFASSSFSEVYLEGGNFEDFQIQDYSQWLKSVHLAPIQISYSLASISSLISDTQKRSFMNSYMQYYYNQVIIPDPSPITFSSQNVAPRWSATCASSACFNALVSGVTTSRDYYYILPVYCSSLSYKTTTSGTKYTPVNYECKQVQLTECPSGQFIGSFTCQNDITGYYAVTPITCCKISVQVEQSSVFVGMVLPPTAPYSTPSDDNNSNNPYQPYVDSSKNAGIRMAVYLAGGCAAFLALLVGGILVHRKLKKKSSYQELN